METIWTNNKVSKSQNKYVLLSLETTLASVNHCITQVKKTTKKRVLSEPAYILFYERKNLRLDDLLPRLFTTQLIIKCQTSYWKIPYLQVYYTCSILYTSVIIGVDIIILNFSYGDLDQYDDTHFDYDASIIMKDVLENADRTDRRNLCSVQWQVFVASVFIGNEDIFVGVFEFENSKWTLGILRNVAGLELW